MERKIAPFYLSLAGGFLLACSPEINLPIPTPKPTALPVTQTKEQPLLPPTPTPRSLVRVRNLEMKTLQILQDRYTKGYISGDSLNYMELCGVLPLTTNTEIGASGLLDWPTYGLINTYFSEWHPGLDIASSFGTQVKAADSGLVVATAKEPWGFGWHILLFHGERMTVYAHLSEIGVKLGNKISKDQQIGRVGSTGESTGDHLHFEVIQKTENGCNQINPLNMLP